MAKRSARLKSWRVVTPMVAIAAFGLSACTNGEESTSTPGTVPPVWTGSPSPEAGAGGHEGPGSAGTANSSGDTLVASLATASGSAAGTVTFSEVDGHVQVTVEAHGLTPGFHGFHVHSAAKCEPGSVAPTGGPPGDFLSAGAHFDVPGHVHAAGSPASGDLTSLQVREDGNADLMTTTSALTLGDLTAGQGTSVIVHAGADNFANIPDRYTLPDGGAVPDDMTVKTGDSGARIACGVIKAS